MKTVGEIIKQARESKGYSQRQLGLYTGISNTEISKIESGQRQNPAPEILKKIAPQIGVTYMELMKAAGYLNDTTKENLQVNESSIEYRGGNQDKIAKALKDNPELLEVWNDINSKEDLRELFKQTHDLPPNDLKTILAIVRAFMGKDDK